MSFSYPPQDPNASGSDPGVRPVSPVAPVVPPVVPVSPPAYPAAAPAPGAYSPAAAAAAKTNTMAILSLVFAFLFAPLAIVFGLIARKQIKERGEGGRGLAIAGLVLGSLSTVAAVLVFVFSAVVVGQVADEAEKAADATWSVTDPAVPGTETGQGSNARHGSMVGDVKKMAALQDAYRAAHPGSPGVEGTTMPGAGAFKVGSKVFTPAEGNLVSVIVAQPSQDLPKGGYCLTVISGGAEGDMVLYDSEVAGGSIVDESNAHLALRGACAAMGADMK